MYPCMARPDLSKEILNTDLVELSLNKMCLCREILNEYHENQRFQGGLVFKANTRLYWREITKNTTKKIHGAFCTGRYVVERRTTTGQKCEAVPRRARSEGS